MQNYEGVYETTLSDIGGSGRIELDVKIQFEVNVDYFDITEVAVTMLHFNGKAITNVTRQRFPNLFNTLDLLAYSYVDGNKQIENRCHQSIPEREQDDYPDPCPVQTAMEKAAYEEYYKTLE